MPGLSVSAQIVSDNYEMRICDDCDSTDWHYANQAVEFTMIQMQQDDEYIYGVSSWIERRHRMED